MARKCTVPKILGFREWFESRFSDLCAAHDASYIAQKGGELGRFIADAQFSMGMWSKGYRWLSIFSFYIIWVAGWVLWYNVTDNKFWQNTLMVLSHVVILMGIGLWII